MGLIDTLRANQDEMLRAFKATKLEVDWGRGHLAFKMRGKNPSGANYVVTRESEEGILVTLLFTRKTGFIQVVAPPHPCSTIEEAISYLKGKLGVD